MKKKASARKKIAPVLAKAAARKRSAGSTRTVVKSASKATGSTSRLHALEAQIDAIDTTQAVIEFRMDGTILHANQNFLAATGYTLDEIVGRHHAIFVDPKHRASDEYKRFWEKLARGEADNGQYRRIRKDGEEVWLQASYNPLKDKAGNLLKVIKYATDITAAKRKQADAESQLRSIGNYQAVIEFKLDGTIVTANENFLEAVGYTLNEIQGKHHSIFVDPAYRQTQDYRLFWDRLGRGEAEGGQYKRIRKDGTELWLQASYNPIFDLNGRACKVIKYATDISKAKAREVEMARAMEETARVMKAMESGDLTELITGTFSGEFAILQDTVNTCIERLRSIVGQIRHGMSTLTLSASEIATGNLDLSQRTEEQGASLTTTAANMEEITATVKRNADNAREANMLALGARQQAESGGSVVTTAITAMSAINQASKAIADIIGVIDEIAFQTNLLALNAAVEAARAGEQGRGFAVVAAEVRSLAQRSASAAKEIKGLIKDSVVRVEEGSRLVNESGATLEKIVSAAKKVSDIISEIAAASIEQSAGIEKIGEAIAQMDAVTQQNSALVEETSAASTTMDEQTRNLSSIVEFFRLSETSDNFNALPKRGTPAKHKTQPGRPNTQATPKRSTAVAPAAAEFSLEEF